MGTNTSHQLPLTPSDPVLASSISHRCLFARATVNAQAEHLLRSLVSEDSKGLTFLELQDGVKDGDAVQSFSANLLIGIPDVQDEPPQQTPQCREPQGHLFVP